MKKILLMFATVLVVSFTGCTVPPNGVVPLTPAQQAIQAATTSYNTLDAAILAADAAVKSGALKGQDARNALKGLTDAKAGLDFALTTMHMATTAANAPISGAKP